MPETQYDNPDNYIELNPIEARQPILSALLFNPAEVWIDTGVESQYPNMDALMDALNAEPALRDLILACVTPIGLISIITNSDFEVPAEMKDVCFTYEMSQLLTEFTSSVIFTNVADDELRAACEDDEGLWVAMAEAFIMWFCGNREMSLDLFGDMSEDMKTHFGFICARWRMYSAIEREVPNTHLALPLNRLYNALIAFESAILYNHLDDDLSNVEFAMMLAMATDKAHDLATSGVLQEVLY